MNPVKIRAERIQANADALVAERGRDWNLDIANAKSFINAATAACDQNDADKAVDYLIEARNIFDQYSPQLRNQVNSFIDYVIQKVG